jgi:hypothetical protein
MCSLFNNAFSVTYDYIESNERMIGEWCIEKEAVVAYFQSTVQEFALRNRGKPWKTSVRIAVLWAEIWTWDIPDTKQEC